MLKDQIENALTFARQGFHVFPAIWKKETKQHTGLCKWGTESSTNPDIIRAWGDMHPDKAYFCVNLKASGLTVIDVDTKDGKGGLNTLEDLLLLNELPPTLQSATPNNGFHYFYKGSAKFGANRLGPGVDIPVMVPLPGSKTGKGNYVGIQAYTPETLPAWVTELAGVQTQANAERDITLIDLDQPHNIQKAITCLTNADPAVEGEGGNDTTYRTMCMVRDLGISEALCVDLGLEHYNPNCSPAWSHTELERIVHNAYTYSQSAPGEMDPTQDFDPIPTTEAKHIKFVSHRALSKDIVFPNWLVKTFIESGTLTLLYGDSGAYKSFLAIDIGLHIAANMDWNGQKTKHGSVFYLAGEGHGGIRRRVHAWNKHHNVHKALPFYVSPHAIHLDKGSNTKLLINSIKGYQDPPPVLVIIDTLATSFGSGDENSTKDMSRFLDHAFGIRDALNCAVVVIHHTGHKAKERPRGAYALMAGVDAFYQVEKTEEGLTCLRSPGKMKDGLPPRDTWFKAESVKVGVDEDLMDVTSLVLEPLDNYREPEPEPRMGKNQTIVYNIVKEFSPISFNQGRVKFKEELTLQGRKYVKQRYDDAVKGLINGGLVVSEGNMLTSLAPIEEDTDDLLS